MLFQLGTAVDTELSDGFVDRGATVVVVPDTVDAGVVGASVAGEATTVVVSAIFTTTSCVPSSSDSTTAICTGFGTVVTLNNIVEATNVSVLCTSTDVFHEV